MTLKINEAVETKIAVAQSSATVSYTVYDESDSSFASGSMSEIGSTGIYTISWTPDAAGEWMVHMTSSNPVTDVAYVYQVAKGVEQDIYDRLDADDSSSGTHNILTGHTTSEQTLVTVSKANIYSLSFYLDVATLISASEGGVVTLRLKNQIDGTNYRTIAKWEFQVGSDEEHPNIEYERLNDYSQITIQLSSAVGSTRACPFRLITMDQGD